MGLSASILSTIYATCFTPDGVRFLLFLAVAPAALGLLAAPLINHVPHVEAGETAHGKRWLSTGGQRLGMCPGCWNRDQVRHDIVVVVCKSNIGLDRCKG